MSRGRPARIIDGVAPGETVYFDDDVIIRGDIGAGAVVTAAGNLFVEGAVDDDASITLAQKNDQITNLSDISQFIYVNNEKIPCGNNHVHMSVGGAIGNNVSITSEGGADIELRYGMGKNCKIGTVFGSIYADVVGSDCKLSVHNGNIFARYVLDHAILSVANKGDINVVYVADNNASLLTRKGHVAVQMVRPECHLTISESAKATFSIAGQLIKRALQNIYGAVSSPSLFRSNSGSNKSPVLQEKSETNIPPFNPSI